MEHEQTNPWLAAAKDAVRRAQWEGAEIPGDDLFVENSRFPERTYIERSQAASGIVEQPLQQVRT